VSIFKVEVAGDRILKLEALGSSEMSGASFSFTLCYDLEVSTLHLDHHENINS